MVLVATPYVSTIERLNLVFASVGLFGALVDCGVQIVVRALWGKNMGRWWW